MENLRTAIQQMKDNSKYMIECISIIAHLNRAYYESLITQGFTEDQALRLTAEQGLSLNMKGGAS